MHKILFFQEEKIIKKICVPTLPRPLTQNTLIFLRPYGFLHSEVSIGNVTASV